MIEARAAVPDDAAELVRLRGVMLADMEGGPPTPGRWQELAERTLRERLAVPASMSSLAGFVVDRPDQPGMLAACAVGAIERRLGEPGNPTGEIGYVFNVSTDAGYRRRGYSRACMAAVLQWYRERGIWRVDLKASKAGEPLYRSIGFTDLTMTALKLVLQPGSDLPG